MFYVQSGVKISKCCQESRGSLMNVIFWGPLQSFEGSIFNPCIQYFDWYVSLTIPLKIWLDTYLILCFAVTTSDILNLSSAYNDTYIVARTFLGNQRTCLHDKYLFLTSISSHQINVNHIDDNACCYAKKEKKSD